MIPTETRAGLSVATPIVEFAQEALAADRAAGGTVSDEAFWDGVAAILADLTPENEALLARRDELQATLDDYHAANPGQPDPAPYRAFLTEIGYLEQEPANVAIATDRVDPEIAVLAGPQLVVPLLNARFALNAVNARWGSLYDALYGTDAISRDGDLAPGTGYNAARGAAVIAEGRRFLDAHVALAVGSHTNATGYAVVDGALTVALNDGSTSGLADPAAFAGYRGDAAAPDRVLLTHNGLHIDIVVDRTGTNGQADAAGIDDIELESALTTIMDLEDSVAAVDADDKALGYRNWRGLMDGTLAEQVTKGGETFTRSANPTASTRRRTAGRSHCLVARCCSSATWATSCAPRPSTMRRGLRCSRASSTRS